MSFASRQQQKKGGGAPAPAAPSGGSSGFDKYRTKKQGGAPAPAPAPEPQLEPQSSGGYSDMSWPEAAFTSVDDSMRVAADTITRGYLDKLLGPEEQEKTRQSRQRLPGFAEVPVDVAAGVASSPYRVGSMGAGALWGAGEGALTAYGNQDSWVPDIGNIAKEGVKGAVTGAVGKKAGDMLGGLYARKAAKANQKYKTNEELMEDAGKVDKRTKGGKDIVRRSERVEEARQAQGKGQKGFEDLLAGVEGYGHKAAGWKYPELEALRAVVEKANKPGVTGNVLAGLGKGLQGGSNPWAKSLMGIATGGYGPAIGNFLEAGGSMMKGAANSTKAEQAQLMALLRDPEGRGLKANPETLAKARDLIAKMMIQGREETQQ